MSIPHKQSTHIISNGLHVCSMFMGRSQDMCIYISKLIMILWPYAVCREQSSSLWVVRILFTRRCLYKNSQERHQDHRRTSKFCELRVRQPTFPNQVMHTRAWFWPAAWRPICKLSQEKLVSHCWYPNIGILVLISQRSDPNIAILILLYFDVTSLLYCCITLWLFDYITMSF